MRTRNPRPSGSAHSAIRNPQSAIRNQPHRGLTLIEMLMAMAITLLMMAAVVTLFANLSGSIRNRRAVIELSGQLRQARQRLARDLAGCTVPSGDGGLTPWAQRAGEAIGYFEIVEDEHNDFDPSDLVDGDTTNGEIDYATSLIPSGGDPHLLLPEQVGKRTYNESDVTNGGGLGDADDVLALTVRSLDGPFVAQLGGGIGQVESNLAEVFWYASENKPGDPGDPGMRTIYRRVLLIAPWLPSGFDYDGKVSVHKDPQTGTWIPNTLADLTRREFRTWHNPLDSSQPFWNFPHLLNVPKEAYAPPYIVLQDALAFDLRVYDPGAPLYETGGVVVDPNDPGGIDVIKGNLTGTLAGYGAYVDLGWNDKGDYKPTLAVPAPLFQYEHEAGWNPRFGADPTVSYPSPPMNPLRGTPAVYDTWSWHYENDGIDQDNRDGDYVPSTGAGLTTGADEGTNGIDDDGTNGVDDVRERETSPPYPVPLRAVKVVLRTYEPDARQVREVSVTNSFVP